MPDETAVAAAVLRAALVARGAATPDDAAIALQLARVASEGRAKWPFDLPLSRIAEHLGAKLPESDADAALASVHGADLWLACACAEGDGAAIAAFDALFADDLVRAHARARTTKIALDDFVQAVRVKLMSSEQPKIRDYIGLGPLRAWVRTVATRTLLDMARPSYLNERPTDDGKFLDVPAPADAPDLAYAKRLYGAAMHTAIQDAAAALSPEERNVLREHYARGLTVDQIAQLHGYHRATAARRVQRARDALLDGIRALLAERLGLSGAELESVLRLVQSEIDVTLERVLA